MRHYQTVRNNCLTVLGALAVMSCSTGSDTQNNLTESEKREGWQLLFDGKSLNGWHVYNKAHAESAWKVDEGELWCDAGTKVHGDLVSDSAFENFDLRYEWRIEKAGNSGVMIDVQETADHKAPQETGPEFQLLDNENVVSHANDPLRIAGSMYGLVPLKGDAKPKSYGEWNQSRIRQQKGRISFFLNGALTCDIVVNSGEWNRLLAQSAFRSYPDYAKKTNGRIALQNHNHDVWFRAIKIRKL